jgi:hypothetical protein
VGIIMNPVLLFYIILAAIGLWILILTIIDATEDIINKINEKEKEKDEYEK